MRTAKLILLLLSAISVCKAQQPVLKVAGKDSARVQLKNYDVSVKVVGNTAITTMEMQFCNSAPRVLEGELTFPMPDGVSISRYAIDINGKMREAVPVEKEKGQVVFENIVRRKVDPGLLEKVEGNNFRTRIYPIPANGCRQVIIAYEQELKMTDKTALIYSLPLHFKDPIPNFNIAFNVFSSAIPEVGSSCNTDLKFEKQNQVWSSGVHKKDFTPDGSFTVVIPKLADAAETMIKQTSGKYYFLINTFPEVKTIEKAIPGKIGLIWDVSLSGLNRNHEKEFSLLEEYIKKKGSLEISVCYVGYDFSKGKTYSINGGNWQELKHDLETVIYDGATNLSNLKQVTPADEYLFFTDGLHTYGNFDFSVLPAKPVYTVCAAANANFSLLKYIAAKTGGSFINLNEMPVMAAFGVLTQQQLQFLGIKQNSSISELYPAVATPVSGNLAVSGISAQPVNRVTLLFGYGSTVALEKTIELDAGKQISYVIDIEKIWAQKKINSLEMMADENKIAITELGKKYGIVTANTSLIVLDDVADYVKYEIDPPAELKADYSRMMAEKKLETAKVEKEAISNALEYYGSLGKWWMKEFKIPVKAKYANPANNLVPVSASRGGHIISGKIVDQNGNPVPFASINIKGTRMGVTTDGNGTFTIRSNDNDVLVASAIGRNSKEIAVSPRVASVNFSLPAATNALSEVVVTSAAGIRRTQRSTSSNVQTVSAGQMNFRSSAYLSASAVDSVSSGFAVASGVGAYAPATATNSNRLNVVTTAVPFTRISEGAKSNDMSGDLPAPPPARTETDRLAFAKAEEDKVALEYKDVSVFKPEREKADSAGIIASPVLDSTGNIPGDISLEERIPERNYLKSLDSVSTGKLYTKYLELRKDNINDPVFYFDVAKRYFKTGDIKTGLKILSNIADMNFEDHELYKMLGYQLMALKQYDEAVNVFRKVVQWRPQEPQSYRDYGLALQAAGKYQQALDTLYLSVIKSFDDDIAGMYNGIEEITVTDLNNLIAMHGKSLNLSSIDKRIIKNMPVDVRVVLNWNFNDTDMDLWVTGPDGERCFYSNKDTKIGGHISNDFTQGYGPEQYMLKKAIKGKYTVEVNYFNDRMQKLAGPVTIMAEIFTNYGKANQASKIIAIQMEPEDNGGVFIGEFEF